LRGADWWLVTDVSGQPNRPICCSEKSGTN